MRKHRLLVPLRLIPGEEISLDDKASHYLARVLRLAPGIEIELFNGDGNDYRCRLTHVGRDRVSAQVLERSANGAESPLRITLAQAMSRGERMDYCLQKATELGVAAFQLLLSDRVELKLTGARLERRMDHWRGVIESACEQCGRATVPGLAAPVSIDAWLQSPARRLVLDTLGGSFLAHQQPGENIEIAVGPEGGFTEQELERMQNAGASLVRMGPRILRTETAGPAAIAVLQCLAGDFAR